MNGRKDSERRWLKAELHSHCSIDPHDYKVCSHTPEQLISEAAKLGFDVLAITCHNRDIWTTELSEYAAGLGITLIPGMEVSTEGRRHVLAYNFHTGAENLNSLAKLRRLSREDTLVIAPHPFFPGPVCLGGLLERNIDVFGAVENSGFHIAGLNFNRRAHRIARRHGKPVVGNGDVHLLWQLGRTFTWIYSEPDVVSILQAVRQGRVRLDTTPLGYTDVIRFWSTVLWRYAFPVNAPPAHGVGDLELIN